MITLDRPTLTARALEDLTASALVVGVGTGPDGPVLLTDALPAEAATPLAMVLTELLQNAVEHAWPEGVGGEVTMTPTRRGGRLRLRVSDDGTGLPPDFDLDASTSLGLSIVRTLVESELGGSLGLVSHDGTVATVDLPVPGAAR